MRMPRKFVWVTLVSAVSATSTGCSSMSGTLPTNLSWKPTTWFKKEFQEPVSVATIWKADTITEPGKPGQRGFGARVYFYNDKSQSIPVEGDLVVHGYLTTPSSRQHSNEQADKRFSFTSEQLASQYSPSDLGASYSIWVPWDEEGGFREEVTLVATFKSKSGSVVQGSPTRLFLPGEARFSEDLKLPDSVQQVSYQKESLPTYDIQPAPLKPVTRVTTIDVPTDSQLNREPEGISVGGGDIRQMAAESESFVGRESMAIKESTISKLPKDSSYQLQKLPPAPHLPASSQ